MTVVLAPLAFVHKTDGGDPLELEEGTTVPSSADADHVDVLIAQGVLGEPKPAAEPPTIAEIEAEVGDDPVKARYQLDLELARPAGERRSTLVKKLQAIVDADPPQA